MVLGNPRYWRRGDRRAISGDRYCLAAMGRMASPAAHPGCAAPGCEGTRARLGLPVRAEVSIGLTGICADHIGIPPPEAGRAWPA